MDSNDNSTKIIHALFGGVTLCGDLQGLPNTWPNNHIWTYKEDVKNISCPKCKKEAEKLKATK